MTTNRMIAEFMSVDTNPNGTFELPQFCILLTNGYFQTEFTEEQLKYHESWDWLMPVVENIDHLEYESERLDAIDNAIKTRVIGDVYKAVVEFIEWYNNQPQ
jgi:hypothetical protein